MLLLMIIQVNIIVLVMKNYLLIVLWILSQIIIVITVKILDYLVLIGTKNIMESTDQNQCLILCLISTGKLLNMMNHQDSSLLPYLYGLVMKLDGEPCVTMIMKVIPMLLKHLLLLLVENYILKNVLMLLIGMVKTLIYQLFMTLKLMEFVLDKKKDSLIAQEMINSTITTVVILKMSS